MAEMPRDDSFDATLAMLTEGYNFIRNRCERLASDAFATRLMLRPAVCVSGEDAAKMFYSRDRFTREGAMPPTTLMLLQDKGSVQLKEGIAHRERKHLFMGLMGNKAIQQHVQLLREEWRQRLALWEEAEEVVLHDELRELLCRATCRWLGIPLKEEEASRRTRELGAMIDGAGNVGPKNWRALLLRTRTERWIKTMVEDLREGRMEARSDSALYLFSWYREKGKLLDSSIAAVEILNLLRPAVAIARYLTFAAHALHEYPRCRERLAAGDERFLHNFVQEVRRFYPFFPFIGGRALQAFDWQGYHFAEGTWVLLDIYGTNHDPRQWPEPDQFNPDRFITWDGSAYNLIPQGGGEFEGGHRCPGEWTTIDIVKAGVRMLVEEMRYEVPEQDLSIDLSKMPALPGSGMILSRVRPRWQAPFDGTATVHRFPERGHPRR